MDFALNSPVTFPASTSVKVYPVSNWPNGQVDTAAAPLGTETDTQTASGTTGLTFTGLAENTNYVAYASVGGQHRYVNFVTSRPPVDIPEGLVDAKGDLLVGTASDTAARKAVGANGTLLSPLSSNGDGLDWADPADVVTGAGTLAARPAASAVLPGFLYFATDDNGGTVYRSTGAAWVQMAHAVTAASGVALATGTATSPTPITSTTTTPGADLSSNGLTITITGGSPVILYACALSFYNTSASKGTRVGIFEDTTRICGNTQGNAMGANTHQTCFMSSGPITPTAGSHTYHIKLATDSAGTANLNVTSDAPGKIWAVAA